MYDKNPLRLKALGLVVPGDSRQVSPQPLVFLKFPSESQEQPKSRVVVEQNVLPGPISTHKPLMETL